MKVIYHDPATDMLTILAKLEPGAGIPAHVHEDLEQTFVLEGSLVDQEGECTAGNSSSAPKAVATRRPRQRLHNAGVLPQANRGAQESAARAGLAHAPQKRSHDCIAAASVGSGDVIVHAHRRRASIRLTRRCRKWTKPRSRTRRWWRKTPPRRKRWRHRRAAMNDRVAAFG